MKMIVSNKPFIILKSNIFIPVSFNFQLQLGPVTENYFERSSSLSSKTYYFLHYDSGINENVIQQKILATIIKILRKNHRPDTHGIYK